MMANHLIAAYLVLHNMLVSQAISFVNQGVIP